MRFWWVNQNQTFKHELAGGYLWSPKRNANGARNPFYEAMREVAPGDIVFSFVNTRIAAVGIAQSICYENPKPLEFGNAGANWENIGWKVRVDFRQIINQVRPKDFIDLLRPVLPGRYSPLQPNGNGLQSVYLANVPVTMANVLIDLIGAEAQTMVNEALTAVIDVFEPNAELAGWEQKLESDIAENIKIPETERINLIRSRVGQGLFRRRVLQIEKRCRLTLVDRPEHLVASHSRPWRDAGNEERLDGENGLMLTPSADHLFGKGFIGFEDNGRLLISPIADRPSLERMGICTDQQVNVGSFTSGQKSYLDFHRSNVFLMSSAK